MTKNKPEYGTPEYEAACELRAKSSKAVFLLIGDCDKQDPESFDCDQALRDLGWVRSDEVKKP